MDQNIEKMVQEARLAIQNATPVNFPKEIFSDMLRSGYIDKVVQNSRRKENLAWSKYGHQIVGYEN